MAKTKETDMENNIVNTFIVVAIAHLRALLAHSTAWPKSSNMIDLYYDRRPQAKALREKPMVLRL